MLKCPNCGLELKEATTYCPECGAVIQIQKVTVTSSTTKDWFMGFFAGILLCAVLIALISLTAAMGPALSIVCSLLSLAAYLAVGWYVRRYSSSLSWGIFSALIGILLLFLGLLALCRGYYRSY